MNSERVKNLGLTLICEFILHKVCKNLKTETALYQHKTKRLVNQLLETVTPIIKESVSATNIQETTKFLKREVDVEEVSEDISIQAQCIEMVVDTLIEADIVKVHELHLLLSNFRDGKKLYTEEEAKFVKK